MMLYIENPKDATRKVLELNEFGKVAVYKINTQKFLYTNNEREINKTIPFTITSKIITYQRRQKTCTLKIINIRHL